jgi:hypothetical protein
MAFFWTHGFSFGWSIGRMIDRRANFSDVWNFRPGFFTYYGFITITTSSRIISTDVAYPSNHQNRFHVEAPNSHALLGYIGLSLQLPGSSFMGFCATSRAFGGESSWDSGRTPQILIAAPRGTYYLPPRAVGWVSGPAHSCASYDYFPFPHFLD